MRLIFFIRCFLDFFFFFYKSFPIIQIKILENNLILDINLLNIFHPMQKVKFDDFLKKCLDNCSEDQQSEKAELIRLLERYMQISKDYNFDAVVPYERQIVNGKIKVYDYNDFIVDFKKILDQIEEAAITGKIKKIKKLDCK